MSTELDQDKQMIIATAEALGKKYGPDYWLDMDSKKQYPKDFLNELAECGFFGLPVPEEYLGSAMGMTELSLVMEALCRSGGGGGPALGYLFGTLGTISILTHGNETQKKKYLPDLAQGKKICAFGLSEPNAGTNSTNIETFAERQGKDFVINGGKWFITNFENSDAIVLMARTTKLKDCSRKSDGMSMFLIDLPAKGFSCTPIDKHAFSYYQSYQLFIENLVISEDCLVGEEGKGFYNMLGTLNPERILVSAGAIGLAKLALQTAIDYAKDRKVFDCAIGAHQAVQHPLASAYAKLESAWLMVQKAATLHDNKHSAKEVGAVANMAKYVAVEAAIDATYHAMQTLGGMGFAKESHIERWWREVQLFRIAPVTQQMTLNYLAEHVLGLPKSY